MQSSSYQRGHTIHSHNNALRNDHYSVRKEKGEQGSKSVWPWSQKKCNSGE